VVGMDRHTPYIARMRSEGTLTAEELMRHKLPGKRTELVRGAMRVREPAGFRHGEIAARLARLVGNHVDRHGLGSVLAAETGFTLARDPDTVRAPDVAFVSHSRLPDITPTGFAEFAPDLAVEVLSPGDRPGDVLGKVADWLDAGSALVWVVDLSSRRVRVYRKDGSESIVEETDSLSGEDVLPGFACSCDMIFG
jgi:Uma2 family endonuclease